MSKTIDSINPTIYLSGTSTISGSVTVSNVPHTIVDSGSVSVSNTPHVVVDSGNINISNTPNVSATVVNTPNINILNSPSVTTLSGSVTNATIVNQPTVSVSSSVGSPVYTSTSISNTPSVTVSGTVSANTNNTSRARRWESAFGYLKTASDHPHIQHAWNYNQSLSRYYTFSGSGTATYSGGLLTITANASNSYILNAKKVISYVNGTGIHIKFACLFNRVSGYIYTGVGTTTDGLFFGFSPGSSNFAIHRFNNSVQSTTNQASWNGPDLPLTMTIDVTKINVYGISYEHLGGGSLKFFIEDSDGIMKLVHIISLNNTITTQTFRNPSLSFGCYTQDQSSCTLSSVGAFYENDIDWELISSRESVNITKSSITTIVPVLSLQLQSTWNGVNYRHFAWLDSLNVINTSNQNMLIRVHYNPTLTGSSFASHSSTSPVYLDTSSSSYSATGTQIMAFYLNSNNGTQNVRIPHIELYAGDIISISATSIGTAGAVACAVDYYNYGVN